MALPNPSPKHQAYHNQISGNKAQWEEARGILTEEEEAREGATKGGVGDAADGEVEARVPLGIQIVPRRDPRLGRRGRGRRRLRHDTRRRGRRDSGEAETDTEKMRSGDCGGVGCFLCGNAVPWNLLGRVPRHGRPGRATEKGQFWLSRP